MDRLSKVQLLGIRAAGAALWGHDVDLYMCSVMAWSLQGAYSANPALPNNAPD